MLPGLETLKFSSQKRERGRSLGSCVASEGCSYERARLSIQPVRQRRLRERKRWKLCEELPACRPSKSNSGPRQIHRKKLPKRHHRQRIRVAGPCGYPGIPSRRLHCRPRSDLQVDPFSGHRAARLAPWRAAEREAGDAVSPAQASPTTLKPLLPQGEGEHEPSPAARKGGRGFLRSEIAFRRYDQSLSAVSNTLPHAGPS